MILNRKKFPRFSRNGFYETNETYMFSLKNWSTRDYWYFEFELGNSFNEYSIIEQIPPEVLEKIKTDQNTFLVASNAYESFNDIIEPLFKFLIDHLIPTHKTILISESSTIDEQVVSIAKKLNIEPVKVWWSLGFERMVKKYRREQPSSFIRTLEKKEYKKKFLNLNRRWRLHRPLLVSLLKLENLLDQGYISLGKSDDNIGWKDCLEELMHKHSNTVLINKLNIFKKQVGVLPELYIDTTDLITNQAHISPSTDKFYQDTYFSVVTETYFYSDENSGLFFSEKTFKSIANFHPFIIVGQTGSLKKLKTLGYKTFHPFINENYDLEKDDSQRMLLIVNEINRLSNLTGTELEKFLDHCLSVVNHNYMILMNKSDRIIELI